MANMYTQRNYEAGINSLPGLYRARVECNKDPKKLGRVQVRVPQCHGIPGTNNALTYNQLPWAFPCTPYPSGNDFGSYIVPEVGSYVWVMFEAGDVSRPVYMGSMHAVDSQSSYDMGTMDVENDPCTKKYVDSGGVWVRPAYHNEVPVDAHPMGDESTEPYINILYKSPKGATIEINEADEHESFTLIDRLGQVISMVCPFTTSANSYNSSRRKGRRVDTHEKASGALFDTDEVSLLQKAVILIRGARDQFLRLVSKRGECRTELVSKDEGNSASVLSLNSGDKLTVLFSCQGSSTSYVELDSNSGTITLAVEKGGSLVSKIELGDSISLWSTGSITSHPYEDPQPATFNWVDKEDEKIVVGDTSNNYSYPTDDAHDNR